MENGGSHRPHIAMLPSPGIGHLFPLAELAKLLVDRHQFTVTFINFAASENKTTQAVLSTLPSSITSVSLPPVPLDDLPDDAAIETRMSIVSLRSLPALRSVLSELRSTTNLVAFLADFFAADGLSVARDLGIFHYMFVPTNLHFLTLMLELPALVDAKKVPCTELAKPVPLPCCVPILAQQIPVPLRDSANEAHRWMIRHAGFYRQAQGILVNSCAAIEPGPAKVLTSATGAPSHPPVYLVGPLIKSPSDSVSKLKSSCIRWLDDQPQGSVLFVSFGSGGTLSRRQLGELALGLELSGHRFLFTVRSTNEDSASAYFTAITKENPLCHLPEGFIDRTKDHGLVVPSWAPQIEVLAHASTGGFLSHCGWNSTLESIAHGVPMIAWPLFAEQMMNAVMLTEAARVAVHPKPGEDGIYDREEVARVVRELMEGEKGKLVRHKVRELKEAAATALVVGGSSYSALEEVTQKWKSF
ncbi:hypothetical protein HPP92_023679 [Vanilla planifolia]|uniref:Glycosyltransferase n=1 Tax=Vanilla planifolia TaxID=51239 RepID=A0A835PIX6_VANPL|nr:hypothetical protein HPP92_024022 [Vanilla planifolia]KAG0455891.1 hypothetical protein HPP92_023679 [Vanilla planifolia]